MKIRDIRIDGFGRFAGVAFGPLEYPVTIFDGRNEAGKSTLLEFVRRVLFGFPRKSGKVNAYPALDGGRYGGHLAIEGRDGRVYDLHRTAGRSYSGDVVLTSVSGHPLPENELAALLGYHSRDVFEQVFAFTLDDLYSDELLNDANVNSQIYSAGMGVTSLPNAVKAIESARTGIFLKGGSSQKIYEVYGKIEAIDDKLREVANNATTYGNLTARLKQVEVELESLATHQRGIQSRYRGQVTLQKGWDAWNDFTTSRNRLNELAEIDEFPRNGVSELEKLENLAVNVREELEATTQRVQEIQDRAVLQIEHDAILDQSSQVRDIERRRSAFDQSVKDTPERQAELAAMRVASENTLADLGQEWDVDRLNGFDLSIVVREDIANFGNRLSEAREAAGRAKAAFAADETARKEATLELEHAKDEFENASPARFDRDEIPEKRRQIRAAGHTLNELSRSEGRTSDFGDQLDDKSDGVSAEASRDWSKIVPSVIGGTALIFLGVLFATTVDGWGFVVGISSVVLGVSLIVAATYLLAIGRPHKLPNESSMAARIRRQLEDAGERSARLREDISECASALGIDSIDLHALEELEESLNVEETRLNELNNIETTFDEIKKRAERRKARCDESRHAMEHAERTLRSSEDQWQTWLRDRGLLKTFSPENVEVLRGLVDLGRTHHAKVTQMEDRIAAIHTDIEQFIELVHPLASAHGFKIDRNDWAGVAVIADELIELHEKVMEESRKRKDARDGLRAAKEEFAKRKDRLTDLDNQIEELLGAAGTHSREEFLQAADIYIERQELKARSAKALEGLQRISGPGEPLELLKADLGCTNPQAIADEITRLEDERVNADARREELSTSLGSIQTELKGLAGEAESSRLRMEKNVLLEQFKGHARDWTRLTLARNLLEEARQKFERERQPGVIRHAESFFTAITAGRYRQVYAPLGEQTITVTDADGRTKQPTELSRGTREQLFLSLRFGLIRELGQRTEPLPVVVDEVLVNFDPERAFRAAAAFTELSKTNQVLVFTCHPTVVDLFRNAACELGVDKPEVVQIK